MLDRIKLEEGWSMLVLVWGMVFVGALAIRQADLIGGLEILGVVSTVAVLAGLLLAKSRFPAGRAHLFSLVYGLALIAYLIGRSLPPELDTWQLRIFDLVNRQATWIGKVFTEESSRDGLIFVMHTSVVYWILGYTAAWYTFRRPRIWRVVLPSGLVLLSVIYYYFGPARLGIYLALYILLALVYVARTHLDSEEKTWRASSVRYESGIRFSFIRASIVTAAIALGLAWTIPALPASAAVSMAVNDVTSPWRRFQDNWTRLFSALRTYGVGTNDTYSGSLVLGGPRSVGSTVVMDVFVPFELPNVYWAGVVLDSYEFGNWTMEARDTYLHYPDDGAFDLPALKARQPYTQTIYNYIPNAGILYAAPDILDTDKQTFVTRIQDPSGKTMISMVKSRFVLRQNDSYQVTSAVSAADSASLRAAPANYPQWINELYLQVPASITPETLALAADLTAPYDNPFDKAIAVRNYLRQNIAYNDQIAAPPDNVEPIHYTLFVSREGYCNYYASAMAIMLRSQGVPSRIVQGYARGEYLEDDGFYRVRQRNAHTWVEVYFPGFGWIQFEPTAALPVDTRPETPGGNAGDGFDDSFFGPDIDPGFEDPLSVDDPRLEDLLNRESPTGPGGEAAGPLGIPRLAYQILAGIGILAVAYFGFVAADQFNRRVEGDVHRSYGRLGTWARWLGLNFRPANTPLERASALAREVPKGERPIYRLTEQYVVDSYSQHRPDPFFDAIQEWRQLRPLLARETVARRLERLRRFFRLGRRLDRAP